MQYYFASDDGLSACRSVVRNIFFVKAYSQFTPLSPFLVAVACRDFMKSHWCIFKIDVLVAFSVKLNLPEKANRSETTPTLRC